MTLDLLSTDARPDLVFDTLTLDLLPVSHLEVSEMDEDLSKALFWVECSSEI